MDEALFNNIVWFWIAAGFIVFLINLNIKAPYGRHTNKSWGPLIDNRLGWFIMELPALLTCPLLFFAGDGPKSGIAYFLVGLWTLHYINRTIIFPLRIRTNGKKIPLGITLSAICFNLANGFICGYYLGNFSRYTPDYWSHPAFIIGSSLFLIGFATNNWADTKLINLRKPGETGYKIPKGGLFKYISCPNLFGEILEWIGFGIAAFALPTATFPLWTMYNLIPRALEHHKWYRRKFEDYPMERKAVFPGLV